jgi:CheY-like chemotaxis protein
MHARTRGASQFSIPGKLTENTRHDNEAVMTEPKRTILVVDDDLIVLAGLEERLLAMGFKVETRDRVLGTSQWIVQNQPWLILLDIMMPAMSGSELASFLRRRGIRAHIILHSSKEMTELQRLVRSTGALGAISKGLTDEQFEQQFRNLTKGVDDEVGSAKRPA